MSPKIISLEGNIGVGKSTLLDAIEAQLIQEGRQHEVVLLREPVDTWAQVRDPITGKTLLECFYEDPARHSFSFQVLVFQTIVRLVRETLATAHPACKVVLCERSLLTSRHVFAQLLKEDGLLSDVEMQVYETLFQGNNIEALYPQSMIYLEASSKTCLERIRRRSREGEALIMFDYLEKCTDRWHAFVASPLCPSVTTYHVDSEDPAARRQVVHQIYRNHLCID